MQRTIDPRIQKIGNTVKKPVSDRNRSEEVIGHTKAILEHVHGKGGWLLWPGFLVPCRVSGELFTMMVWGRDDVVPRFAGTCDTAGPRGRVRNSEEVVEWIDLALERLVRGVGRSLWWRRGKLDGHMSAGDDGGRSCLRSSSGGDEIPGTGDGAGSIGGGLSGDGGGDDSDSGRHFVDLK